MKKNLTILQIVIPLISVSLLIAAPTIDPPAGKMIIPEDHELSVYEDSVKSLIAFKAILKVLKDPRCINCHPSGDRPRQGDDQHLHKFNVVRGAINLGSTIQNCQSCHKSENKPYSEVPGAPHWALAPESMGWFGLPDIEIGQRLVDPSMNGGRTPEELVKHMSEDKLVLWGWDPGEGRNPVKVPFEEFKAALNTWLENGAYVPQ